MGKKKEVKDDDDDDDDDGDDDDIADDDEDDEDDEEEDEDDEEDEIKRGTFYMGNIPYGFNKRNMWKYFSQFGELVSIDVPSSEEVDGKSYAFITFQIKEVAEI